MRRNAMIREIVAAAGDDTNASRDGPAIDEGTAMHASTHAALALLLLAAQGAHAQAPLPAGFVDAAAVVDGLVVDMRYFGANNFVGERIDGYEGPRCLLSVPAANALAAVERDLAARGLGLKVFDCYRPQRAVAQFVRWAQRIDDVKRKREFYPDVDKRDLFKEGYISDRSGHSRGSTLDLTLVRRADARELDMGSPFDFFSPKSWPSDTSVSDQAQKNRAQLAAAMIRAGFRPYDKEWWHFTLNNEPFPETYFDFPVR
jgi:D-alanyl-D-alanine dipeptidase